MVILLKGGRRGGTIFSKQVPNCVAPTPKHCAVTVDVAAGSTVGGAGAMVAGGADGGGGGSDWTGHDGECMRE